MPVVKSPRLLGRFAVCALHLERLAFQRSHETWFPASTLHSQVNDANNGHLAETSDIDRG